MMGLNKFFAATFLFAVLFVSSTANATLLSYSDRSTFETMGTVYENYGFEDFGPNSESLGASWNAHGVTYTSVDNYVLIGRLGSKPPPVSNTISSNAWLSLTGNLDVGTNYNMLGFDLAVIFVTATPGNITLTIYTNMATYIYDDLSLPDIILGQEFFGFVSSEGELFTGFNLTSDTWGTAAALDNVTLGTAVVPEPSVLLLLSSGLIGWISIAKRKKA